MTSSELSEKPEINSYSVELQFRNEEKRHHSLNEKGETCAR